MDERTRNHGILTSDALMGDEKIQLTQATDDERILLALRSEVERVIREHFPYEIRDASRLLWELARRMEDIAP